MVRTHVLGVDVGSATCILATIKQQAVTVVTNEISARTTPSLVGFSKNERLLGEPALSLIKSNFANTCRNIKLIMGRNADKLENEQLRSLCPIVNCILHGENGEPKKGEAGYKITIGDQQRILSATEVMSSLLTQLKRTAEEFVGGEIKDVVIGVPGWYPDISRQAMANAAKISGLDCLRVTSEHVATAVDYGMFRKSQFNTDEFTTVLFVGMGHSTTCASVTQFKKDSALVLSEASDCSLGGRDMDTLLVNKAAEEFAKMNGGKDPRKSTKSLLKLEVEAARAKTILSANPEAVMSCEFLDGENDYNGIIKREEFETLCGDFKKKLLALIRKAVKDASDAALKESKVVNIDCVEIVGGCTRVPWVQRAIREEFGLTEGGENDIKKTLNLEETVARGCTLQAAMLSNAFKVTDYTVIERVKHGICMTWKGAGPRIGEERDGENQSLQIEPAEEPNPEKTQEMVIFERGQEMGIKGLDVWLTFKRRGDFELTFTYQNKDELVAGVGEDIGRYKIQVPQLPDVELPEVKVLVSINASGILVVNRAEIKEVATKTVSEKREVKSDDAHEAAADTTMADDSESAAEPPKEAEPKYEYVDVIKKVTKMRECPIVAFKPDGYLTPSQVNELKEVERKSVVADQALRDARNEMNLLESFIYKARSQLKSDFDKFSTDAEKSAINAALDETEDWLYGHPDETKDVYCGRRVDLINIERPVSKRAEEHHTRPQAATRLRNAIASTMSVADLYQRDPAYAHLDHLKIQSLVDQAVADEKWLNEQLAAQEKRPKNADVGVTSSEINERSRILEEDSQRVLRAPPPAPAAVPQAVPETHCGAPGEAPVDAPVIETPSDDLD